MKHVRLIATALLAGLLAAASPARAQEDVIVCEKQSGDVAIAACTRAINSGRLSSGQLAWAYHNRAVEYEIQKKIDQAMTDYTHALRIDARRPTSLIGRGNCLIYKREYDRAIEDYNKALAISPQDANALQNRCLAYYHKKTFGRARDDCERAIAVTARNAADRRSQDKARDILERLKAENH
jgi:tetratricopeptide (TPR) repeat protein